MYLQSGLESSDCCRISNVCYLYCRVMFCCMYRPVAELCLDTPVLYFRLALNRLVLSSVVLMRDCTELCRPIVMLCDIVRTVLCYMLVLCCLVSLCCCGILCRFSPWLLVSEDMKALLSYRKFIPCMWLIP